jgi:hypothetical protein
MFVFKGEHCFVYFGPFRGNELERAAGGLRGIDAEHWGRPHPTPLRSHNTNTFFRFVPRVEHITSTVSVFQLAATDK